MGGYCITLHGTSPDILQQHHSAHMKLPYLEAQAPVTQTCKHSRSPEAACEHCGCGHGVHGCCCTMRTLGVQGGSSIQRQTKQSQAGPSGLLGFCLCGQPVGVPAPLVTQQRVLAQLGILSSSLSPAPDAPLTHCQGTPVHQAHPQP
jgi:hypothetical protein